MDEPLLAEQARVLEMIVRGAPLAGVLGVLCGIVERHAAQPVRAAIALDGSELEAGPTADPTWSTPVMSSNGTLLGTLVMWFAEPREPDPHERHLAEVVAHTAALAIERDRTDRTARDLASRYRAIVESSPECVKLVAPDGALLQINAAGLRMIELDSEAEAVGRSVYSMIAPEHRDAFRAFNEAVCRGEGGSLELDIVGARGTRRAMETRAVPLPAPAGGFIHLAVSRDASARVAAARALEKSRARLDYAVRLSGLGFWYCDLPFGELNWDARVRDHFFVPPGERVTIDTFYARIHPDDRQLTREAIDASIKHHTSCDVVYRTVDPASGAIKWIRALGGAAYDKDGTPAQFDGVTVEITAHKREEERLAGVARAALTIHSSSSFASVLQVVTEEVRALIGADRAVTVIAADQQPRACTVAFADARRGRDERACDPAAVDAVMGRLTRPMRLGRAELERPAAWPDLLGPGGGGAPRRGVLAVPFVGRDGARLGFVEISDKLDGELTAADEAIAIQLAQLAVVAIENTRLYDRLREQDRKKDEFLATLAHELRNPLAPIRTGLHVLSHEVTPEQAARARDMMARQLVHLVRMVDDLLDISRVTLGKITLQKQRIDLRAILDSAIETTRSLLDAARHELVVRLPSQALPLDVDPTRLSQAFSNLINNAAKYTPPGGRIAITADVEAATLTVRVKDSGIGIPAEMLPYVFDMFTQVGRTIDRGQGGLGIGLTLVRRLIEMHGGSVIAESPGPARGSTFVVRLSLAEVAEPAAAQAGDPARDADNLKILVVDDNIDAAEMLGMLLELRGYRTRLAHTGPAALAVAADFEPQVIFLDIGLPGLNGYEVAERLRASGRQPQPVLVALTGWGTDEDRRQSKAAGFDGHLVKPVDIRQLEATLGELRRTPS
ncbi:MAG TPA: ATP-binding protein [Kofleriaceae bacterium]|nr:ATP-binding protein [Kofleriaceae bacterium]